MDKRIEAETSVWTECSLAIRAHKSNSSEFVELYDFITAKEMKAELGEDLAKDLMERHEANEKKLPANMKGQFIKVNPQFPKNGELWRYKCFKSYTHALRNVTGTEVSALREATVDEDDFDNLLDDAMNDEPSNLGSGLPPQRPQQDRAKKEKKDTLYPILQRACWSFNIAIQGRRPTTSLELKLTPKQCKLAGTNLGTTFALTECRGDLAWHLLFFPLWSHYWKCAAICWRCNAARIPRFGPLFTDFNMVWQLRTTSEWIRDCLPHPPNPLIYVQGFDVSMLKHCSMHTCNLGSFTILNAEGLIMLAEHRATVWHCTFDEALRHLDPDFRSWTHMNRASCSHRLWGAKHLHMENNDGARTFPWLNAKAYNARVILAGLAAGLSQGQSQMLSQIEGGSAHAWADRKQLWGAGIAAVCSWAEWQRLSELYPRYLNDAQANHLHDLGMQCIHLYNFSAAVAATQGQLRWLILPKLHIFHHMILDLPVNFQNVRPFHCFSGEDYMEFLKQVCLSTCTASNMEKRVLKRALLKCMAQCHTSISALK